MFGAKHPEISYDYIRGFTEVEGRFTFSISTRILKSGEVVRTKIPAFSIGMHERDEGLLKKIRDSLGLKNKIYVFKAFRKDGINRGRKAFIIVRDFGSLKNIIVPLFYRGLHGNKAAQYESWIKTIGEDPMIPRLYRLIYQLYQSGFYDRNNRFL